MIYLLQHLEGEAMRTVQYFSNDKMGYTMALKGLLSPFSSFGENDKRMIYTVII